MRPPVGSAYGLALLAISVRAAGCALRDTRPPRHHVHTVQSPGGRARAATFGRLGVMKSPLSGTVEAAVRGAVVPELAAGSDPMPAAAALAGLYEALAGHLQPLLGSAGVQ